MTTETKQKIEDLASMAEQLFSMGEALRCAMFECDDSADGYGPAMYLFTNLLFQYKKDMAELEARVYPPRVQPGEAAHA